MSFLIECRSERARFSSTATCARNTGPSSIAGSTASLAHAGPVPPVPPAPTPAPVVGGTSSDMVGRAGAGPGGAERGRGGPSGSNGRSLGPDWGDFGSIGLTDARATVGGAGRRGHEVEVVPVAK